MVIHLKFVVNGKEYKEESFDILLRASIIQYNYDKNEVQKKLHFDKLVTIKDDIFEIK